MAYKIVDAETLDAGLTQVADAIRAKAGTAEALAFPDGMASAIANFSALNFSVVGGTAQPASPTENTIWVNTDQTITDWILSPDEPESPVEGMVWVKTAEHAKRRFNVLTGETVMIGVAVSYQYTGGAWLAKELQIYQNGDWQDGKATLYDPDTLSGDLGGAWIAIRAAYDASSDWWIPTACEITYDGNALCMLTEAGYYDRHQGVVAKEHLINLGGFSTITVKFSEISYNGTSNAISLRVFSDGDYSDGIVQEHIASLALVNYDKTENTLTDVTYTLDISGLSVAARIGFLISLENQQAAQAKLSAYLTELYLE